MDMVVLFQEIPLVIIMILLMVMRVIILILIMIMMMTMIIMMLVWSYIFRLTGNPHPQLPKYPRMLEKLVLEYICLILSSTVILL